MKGSILLKNIDGKIKILKKSYCLRGLQDELEKLSHDYANMFQKIKMEFYKKSISGKHGKHPIGYFMVSGPDKITIYNKICNKGWIFAAQLVKICTFYLVRPKCKFCKYEINNYDFASDKRMTFGLIHEDIEKLNEDE